MILDTLGENLTHMKQNKNSASDGELHRYKLCMYTGLSKSRHSTAYRFRQVVNQSSIARFVKKYARRFGEPSDFAEPPKLGAQVRSNVSRLVMPVGRRL